MSTLDENGDERDMELDTIHIEGSDENGETSEEQLKNSYALGLRIDPETGLPRITSMGRGLIARIMAQKAAEADIPVEKDPEMIRRMFKPIDDRVIPSRTYAVIAEILTFIYQLNEAFTRDNVEEYLEEEVKKTEESKDEPENRETIKTGEYVGEEIFEDY